MIAELVDTGREHWPSNAIDDLVAADGSPECRPATAEVFSPGHAKPARGLLSQRFRAKRALFLWFEWPLNEQGWKRPTAATSRSLCRLLKGTPEIDWVASPEHARQLVEWGLDGGIDHLESFDSVADLNHDALRLASLFFTRPFLRAAASELLPSVHLERWNEGYCPVCERRPAMAILKKDDGARFLWCQWCDACWPFSRIRCVFCDNADQATLRHFYVEPQKRLRVDVCEMCRCYIKAIDERLIPCSSLADVLRVELASGDYDLCAAEYGFDRRRLSREGYSGSKKPVRNWKKN